MKVNRGRVSFLWLSLWKVLGENIAVRWSNICVIVLDGLCYFKAKFLVKIDGLFIVSLDMQINLRDVLFGAQIKNMVQELRTWAQPERIRYTDPPSDQSSRTTTEFMSNNFSISKLDCCG